MTTAISRRYGTILSESMTCEGVDPLTFLQHARGQARFLWASPDNAHVVAGFGNAVELSAWGPLRFEGIERQARQLFSQWEGAGPAPKLFGGFSFRADFVPDNAWTSFAAAQFVLPHYQLELSPRGKVLSVHAELQGDELSRSDLREALEARYELLRQETSRVEPQAELLGLHDLTDKTTWAQMIAAAQANMTAGELKKVVLARLKEARFASAPNLLGVLRRLSNRYPDCYRFLVEPRPGHAFLGATPELLASVAGRELQTMSLAGSAPRGASPAEDEALARDLLADPKERYEHDLVSERVLERLSALGRPEAGELEVLKLSNIQHLYTPITARLERKTGILPVIRALHPTPALGGEPSAAGQAFIREVETQPRGWYAAPVGVVTAELDGAFAVAIRSAVVQTERAWLFAGAGVVPASRADKEWRETALKFRPMLNALESG